MGLLRKIPQELTSNPIPLQRQSRGLLVCLLYHKHQAVSIRRAFQNKNPPKPEGTAYAISSGKSETCHLMHDWKAFRYSRYADLWDTYLWLLDIPQLFLTDVSSDANCSLWKCRVAWSRELLKSWFRQHFTDLCNSEKPQGLSQRNWRCKHLLGCLLRPAGSLCAFLEHLTQRGFEPLLGIPRRYGTAAG